MLCAYYHSAMATIIHFPNANKFYLNKRYVLKLWIWTSIQIPNETIGRISLKIRLATTDRTETEINVAKITVTTILSKAIIKAFLTTSKTAGQHSLPAVTCSKLTIETLGPEVKYVQS